MVLITYKYLIMHPIQEKILKLAQKIDLDPTKLSLTGRLVGESHPQKVKYHIEKLIQDGFLSIDETSNRLRVLKPIKDFIGNIFKLPIVGCANCGPATLLAHENITGFLHLSKNIVGRSSPEGLFAVKAEGNSLDQATNIPGGPVTDGDYIIVDGNNRNPQNGEYVLSVIGDAANVKRFYQDRENQTIRLVSESSQNIPPILIHESDMDDYMVNGVVIKVINK